MEIKVNLTQEESTILAHAINTMDIKGCDAPIAASLIAKLNDAFNANGENVTQMS